MKTYWVATTIVVRNGWKSAKNRWHCSACGERCEIIIDLEKEPDDRDCKQHAGLQRICIHCKEKYGCYLGRDTKTCGQCDGICATSTEQSHGICDPCFPIVQAINRANRTTPLPIST